MVRSITWMFCFFHIKTYLIIWTTEFYRKLWNWKARKNCEKIAKKIFKKVQIWVQLQRRELTYFFSFLCERSLIYKFSNALYRIYNSQTKDGLGGLRQAQKQIDKDRAEYEVKIRESVLENVSSGWRKPIAFGRGGKANAKLWIRNWGERRMGASFDKRAAHKDKKWTFRLRLKWSGQPGI